MVRQKIAEVRLTAALVRLAQTELLTKLDLADVTTKLRQR